MKKYITQAILILLSFINNAYAITCSTNNKSGLSYHTATLSGISPPAFNPNAYAVGDIIYSATGSVSINNFNGSSPLFICDAPWIWYNLSTIGVAVNNIYPTSINGLGLRVKEAQYWPYLSTGQQPARAC